MTKSSRFFMYLHLKKYLWIWLCSCLALAFLLPNHYKPWVSFHQEFLSFLGFLPFTLLILLNRNNSSRSGLTPLNLVLLLALPLLALQKYLGIIPYNGDAWLYFFYISVASITIKIFSTRPIQKTDWLIFWSALLFSGIISWGIMLHQIFSLELLQIFAIEIKPGDRPYANLAQPNHLSTLLVLSCIGTLYLYSKNKIQTITCVIALIAISQGIALTQTRTVFLTLLVISGSVFISNKSLDLNLEKKLIFLIFLFVILWTFINPLIYQSIIGQDTETALSRPLNNVRLIFLEQSILGVLNHPWLGYGFGQIPAAQIDTINSVTASKESFTISFHNIFADIFVWTGIPFGIIFSTALAFALIFAFKNIKTQEDFTALLGTIAIGTHAILELPIHYAYFLLPTCLFLGHLLHKTPIHKKNIESSLQIMWIALYTVAIFIGFKIFQEYFFWEKKWEQTNYKISKFEIHEKIQPPKHIILDHLNDLNWLRELDATQNLSIADLDRAEKTIKRNPTPSEILKYATMLSLNGDSEKASHYLEVVCGIYPERVCKSVMTEWVENLKK